MDVEDPENPVSGQPNTTAGEGLSPDPSRPGEPSSGPAGPHAGIPVVGLGGSAGALASFEAFFDSMPADSGAAFVVVQHMSTAHGSLLPELLAQHTRMRVVEAAGGMQVEPDCVYIIPPAKYVGIRNGILFLAEPAPRHGAQMPVDFFFRCLAEDRAERAICVLCSGTGTDGTLGARAVRGAGGMVIAQDPRTALFGDMPRSAMAAGLVDRVLPAERTPAAVLKYLQHPYVKERERLAPPEARAKAPEVQDILALVLEQTGCDFRSYKPPTVLRRIGRRMGLLHISEISRYVARLQRDPGEVKQLVRDLLINVTAFFREPEAFDEVRDLVVAPLVRTRPANEPLRVWVPACATGEEAYSLAILLLEELAKASKNCPLQVFATDLDEEALEVARAGFYPENIAADVGPERLLKFFVRIGRGYQVRDSLRQALTFAKQNVLTDPPFSKMDLISCRNLLIYLDADAQRKLMALFNFALKPGGHLFLGRPETVAGQNDLFETVSRKTRLCRRLTPARPLFLDSPILPGKRKPILPAPATNASAASNFADVIRLEILRHFGASAVLVDRKGKILQFHGQTERYLNLPAPGPDFNLFELAKERLSTKLRLAVHSAVRDRKPVVLEGVPFTRDAGSAFARLSVTPVLRKAESEPLMVVIFEDVSKPAEAEAEAVPVPEDETAVKRLEDELRVTQQDLQSTIEELQSSNERLRVANEEITSTNEELESTNEELMTSAEELQSSNEELTAVISQLQEKIHLLDRANSDMANLLRSSQIATLFLDNEWRIRFCSPAMTHVLGITSSDIGRPLSETEMRLIGCDLAADLRAVARNGSMIEREVQHLDGSCYLMRLIPYCTQGDRTDGVVVSFVDITQLRRAERMVTAIVESSGDAIFAKTPGGVILTWNRAAERMYGYSAQEAIGRHVSMLAPADRVREVTELLEKIERGETITLHETRRVPKHGREIDVSLSISPIKDVSGQVIGAATIARDISERKRAEQALRKSEQRFRTLVESSPNALVLAAADGTITLLNRQAEAMFGYGRDELIGQAVEVLMPERFRKRHRSSRAAFTTRPQQRPMGAGRDLIAVRKDGSEFPAEIGLTPLEMPEGSLTLATIIDITERTRRGGKPPVEES
ncbi:MAG: PAS domain S-box protein [bacterium]